MLFHFWNGIYNCFGRVETDSINGTHNDHTLGKITYSMWKLGAAYILTKSSGLLFNSTILSGHCKEHRLNSHSCYCLMYPQILWVQPKWATPAPLFWMVQYLQWVEACMLLQTAEKYVHKDLAKCIWWYISILKLGWSLGSIFQSFTAQLIAASKTIYSWTFLIRFCLIQEITP